MEGCGRQLVQFTAHKRRAGSSLFNTRKPTKKPVQGGTALDRRAIKDEVAVSLGAVTIPVESVDLEVGKLDRAAVSSSSVTTDRGHYGNLAYKSYLAKDYKRAIDYAEKQIAVGAKQFESLLLKATALKRLGSTELAVKAGLACLDYTRASPVPYILAIQGLIVLQDYAAADHLVCSAFKNASPSHPMFKKLVSLKAELQLKLTTRRNPPQAETLSQNWVEALPLELLVKILRALPFSSLLGLTRACRRWRAALIQIPDLWADVVLDFTSASPNLARGSGRRQPTEFVLHSLLIRANTRLRTITLAHCPKLDWKWFVVLHHFPRPLLTRIHINNSDVSVPFLKPALRALGAQLTHLTLASCKLTEDAVALILPACPALVSLDISGMGVPSEELFLDSRGRLRRAYPSLQWLGLAETALGERFIENLGSVFPNLTGINLNKVGTFKVPMLSKLCECLPKLVDLSLQRMSYIFAYRTELILHFQLMGETYSALTHLNLSHNHFINDQALLCLSRCVASLKLLDISYTFVGGAGLALINHSPSLETLNLGSCSQMDDSAIAALTLTPCVQNCHLRALDLSGLKLEQTALSLVTRTFAPFITHLNLSSSSASYFCFQAWVAEPPQRLESLRLANCPMISTDFAAKLRSTLPWAKVYHTIPS